MNSIGNAIGLGNQVQIGNAEGLSVRKNNFFVSNSAGGVARFRVKDNSAFIVKGS